MQISYENEPVYPGKPNELRPGSQLYHHYEQSGSAPASRVHWFDFHTRAAHKLHVHYPGRFYKLVLCIEGNSRSVPQFSPGYGFSTGRALFYRTEPESYEAALPADTRFKVIHVHLSDAHTTMLQNEVPALFEKPVAIMPLSAECAGSFLQLKSLAKENPGLLPFFEEKLITDQLYAIASHLLPRGGGKAILEEAIGHIHRADRYLTISELAHKAGTNTFRLKQLFREEMRTSVFQYQSGLRLERAARFLLDTSMSVSEVAFQCGYDSPAAFSNAFMKKYGVRPQAFKNSRLHK